MKKNPNWTSETAPKGKGKSVKRYQFTITDIAEMTGKHPQTIRNDISKGKLDMLDMRSICKYINKKEKRLNEKS